MAGYIKIHRKLLDWGWYSDTNTFRVFMHLLLIASYEDNEFRGHKIKAGQAVCGRKQLAADLGMSERSVRTALDHLKSTNEITITTTNKFSIITIENWGKYQLRDGESGQQNDQQSDQQPTNNRPATDHTQEIKKVRNKEDIYRDVPEPLKEAFMEWAKMRDKIKKPITSKATVTRALNTLYKLSKRTDVQIQIINQSTDKCWQSFYELKVEAKPKAYREFEKEPEYKSEEMPEDIRKKLEGMFNAS